jgi:primosomal protein N' (replication factor Y)
MYYYEVWVRSNYYHGSGGLTYGSNVRVEIGKLVSVELKKELVSGVVMSTVTKPKIKIKPLINISPLPPLPRTNLELMRWLAEYYPSPIGIITQQFIPPGVINLKQVAKNIPKTKFTKKGLPKLTSEQRQAITQIKSDDTFILHGRTGSGKTRIYQELALNELDNDRSVIMLTPEISLTTQLESEFRSLFGPRVILLHSTLSPKARAEHWTSILSQPGPLVVIGPRSAIFSPLKNLGLIIIDEEHEPAYKQQQAPYYVTSRVAARLRELHAAKLILGSATPLISDYYLAQTKNKPIIRLTKLAKQGLVSDLNTVVVDCKNRSLFPRSANFSAPLIDAVSDALAAGEQSLLYLNRRGTARAIICANCSWQARCPRCDLPLTYHGDSHILLCHVCNYSTAAPTICPDCKQPEVKYLSIGTKAVVTEAERLFPGARIVRFDSDQVKAERLEQRYAEIKDGGADIIVGTQLVAKGWDLPKLSVVGVLLADTSLQLPDFSANERAFQLISQVIGRVGRGHRKGTAVIQTYQPNAEAIVAATTGNWDQFYTLELSERQVFGYPPFMHLLRLTLSRSSAKSAEAAAQALVLKLKDHAVYIEGPAPAFHEKQNNKYRWQIVVKSKQRGVLVGIIRSLPSGWSSDIDPSDLI